MPWTNKCLVLAPLKVESAEQAIRLISGALYQHGFVQETFVEAVLKREEVYPTGLPTPDIQVAIPHTDPEHIIRPAIALGVLEEPVEFKEMGNPDSTLKVHLICMLAVTQSESLVSLLGSLVEVFQDTAFLRQICSSNQPESIANLFNARIPDLQEA